MKTKMTILALTAVMTAASFAAHAETVVKDVYTTQEAMPSVKQVNFSEFDLNKDGKLNRYEVGEKLFYIFDTDGNEVIDNIEYNRPMVLTIIPMKKQEIIAIDFDDDGIADTAKYDQESFLKQSMLARFDKDMDGLSAKDFLNRVYWQLDDNKDKTVDIKEFKEAYIAVTSPSAANKNRYNN